VQRVKGITEIHLGLNINYKIYSSAALEEEVEFARNSHRCSSSLGAHIKK
jgi:hypothetical protein